MSDLVLYNVWEKQTIRFYNVNFKQIKVVLESDIPNKRITSVTRNNKQNSQWCRPFSVLRRQFIPREEV